MRFDDNEIQELAEFFTRRFPQADQRQHMASAVGLPGTPDDWGVLLLQAQSRGRLHKLADVTAEAAPEDDNLRDVCTILTAPRRRRRQTTVVVSSAVVLALGLVGLTMSRPDSTEPALAAPTLAEPVAVLASADVTPPPVAPPIQEVEPEVIESAPQTVEPEVVAAAPASTSRRGRCRAAKDELIGYWYAGEASPGSAGSTIEVPVTVNVRADYPDTHSNFNARADVRCVLIEGDRLVLSVDPIRVPGKRYWVPLYGRDLP